VFLLRRMLNTPVTDEQARRSEQESRIFERRFREYQVCLQQVERLESSIWYTAGLLGIGSTAGFISVMGKDAHSRAPLGTILVVAILAITVSLVWLRFAGRWRSIQHVKFKRMAKIEEEIGFCQSRLVAERDIEVQAHWRHLQEKGKLVQRLWTRLWYRLEEKPDAAKAEEAPRDYEVRGNRPVIELLVITNLLIWCSVTLYAAHKMGDLLSVSVVLFGSLILDICFWRRL
jgi:hypothetical protein